MLNWSASRLKLTSGIGALGMAANLASLADREIIPIWMVLIISLLPVFIFIVIKPNEFFKDKTVDYFHFFASVFYMTSFMITIISCYRTVPLKNLLLYSSLMTLGLIPCIVFMYNFLKITKADK